MKTGAPSTLLQIEQRLVELGYDPGPARVSPKTLWSEGREGEIAIHAVRLTMITDGSGRSVADAGAAGLIMRDQGAGSAHYSLNDLVIVAFHDQIRLETACAGSM